MEKIEQQIPQMPFELCLGLFLRVPRIIPYFGCRYLLFERRQLSDLLIKP